MAGGPPEPSSSKTTQAPGTHPAPRQSSCAWDGAAVSGAGAGGGEYCAVPESTSASLFTCFFFVLKKLDSALDGPALLILTILCVNIRNCLLPTSKIKALQLMTMLSEYVTDEAKLDRLVPYVVELLHDEAASVRVGAVRALLRIVRLSSVVSRVPVLTAEN